MREKAKVAMTEEHFKKIVDKLVVLKDTSELMIDLAYSSLFLNSRSLAEEVEALENYMDDLHTDFERLVLSSGFTPEESKDFLGLIRLGVVTEQIADAAMEIADVVELPDQELKKRTIADWDKIQQMGLKVEIPYQKLKNIFLINKCHLYLFIDDNIITPGPYTYHQEYFRDAAYTVTALEKMGYHKEAEHILLNYPNRHGQINHENHLSNQESYEHIYNS